MNYILGARLRQTKEVDRSVLGRAGRYKVVHGPQGKSQDPSPLGVKEIGLEDRPLELFPGPVADRPAIRTFAVRTGVLAFSTISGTDEAVFRDFPGKGH